MSKKVVEKKTGPNSILKIVTEEVRIRKAVNDESVTLKTRNAKLKFAMDVVFNEGILCSSDFIKLEGLMKKKHTVPVEKKKN